MDSAGSNYNYNIFNYNQNSQQHQHPSQNHQNYHDASSQDALHNSDAPPHQQLPLQQQQQHQHQQHQQYHQSDRLAFNRNDDVYTGDQSRLHDQVPLSSSLSSSSSGLEQASDSTQTGYGPTSLVVKYVNLNLVRTMIAQHALEIIIVLVIIIYLVYYFSRISMVSA